MICKNTVKQKLFAIYNLITIPWYCTICWNTLGIILGVIMPAGSCGHMFGGQNLAKNSYFK